MKKVLLSLLTITVVGTLITGGVMALFSDEEVVGQNVFTAGTLDLEVSSNPHPIPFTIDDMEPGDTETLTLKLTNVGSIAGIIKVEVSPIINYENGRNGPEIAAGDTYTVGPLGGELGHNLIVPAMTMWAPLGITNLPQYYDMRVDFWGTWGARLNDVGGHTYWLEQRNSGPAILAGSDILGPGEMIEFSITVKLPSEIGNIVQGDSVEFDLIFTLEQVQP